MKLNYKRTILIGFAFMSILAFWQFYDQVIPYLLENVFGLSTFAANAIMSVDNILAIFMLPLFGAISDRTRSPLGKRTPYILFGTIAAVVLMIILAFTEEARHFPGFMITLFLLLFVMSTYRTPAVAYMPDVTEKPLRSKANAIINLVGYIGGIFSTIVMMFMLSSDKNNAGETVYDENQSFLPVFFVIAAFMLVSVLILVFTIRENQLVAQVHIEENVPEKDEKSPAGKLPKPVMRSLVLILSSVFLWYMSYNAVTTAFSRYCVTIWHTDLGTSSGYLMTATIAAIAAFVPLGFVSGALGRKKTILLGVALMSACFSAAGFITEQTPAMYAVLALVGVAWAAINVNSYPMVVEMSSGSDVGKYTGFYYTFSMAAQITTPLLSGFLIDRLGWGYSILFPYAVVFAAASFVTMCFVKHGDTKPADRKVMEAAADMED